MSISSVSSSRIPSSPASSFRSLVLLATLLAAAAAPCAAQVAVFTVGEHGSYPTIQDALSHVINGWTNEIRIETGSYFENVVISNALVPLTSGGIYLYGGWNATFTAQTLDPSLTVIDADSDGRCLDVRLTVAGATTIRLFYLTLANGFDEMGGGVYLAASGQTQLDVKHTVFMNNTAENGSGPSNGGGLYATMSGGNNTLGVYDSSFTGNVARPPGGVGQANGGGAYVSISGGLSAVFRGVDFISNIAEGNTSEQGAGLFLLAENDCIGWVQDVRFTSNQTTATTGGPSVAGIGLFLYAGGTSIAGVRQVTLVDNLSQTNVGSQLLVWALNYADVDASDVLTAGSHTGALIQTYNDATVALTNFTAAGNLVSGISLWRVDASSELTMDNSLLYGNGVDLEVLGNSPAASHNLVGINPSFVDAPGGDYRLATGSPAANAGTNTPAAGLGTADCDGGIRVVDGIVDIGAYEGVNLIFSDGFEVYGTGRWSATAP